MTAAKRHDKRVGYVRVSSVDESTERQLDGVELDKVFTDKASGKDNARPQLQAALDYLREGDLLLAHSMDRLVSSVSSSLRNPAFLNIICSTGGIQCSSFNA